MIDTEEQWELDIGAVVYSKFFAVCYNSSIRPVPPREDEFMINSFRVNIDTSDVNHTTYNMDSEVNLTQGEIKYVKENYEASIATLEREEKNLETLASVLDSQNYKEWVEKTPDRITLHVNYKEDNIGTKAKEITTTYDLNLIKENYSTLENKDRLSEGGRPVRRKVKFSPKPTYCATSPAC